MLIFSHLPHRAQDRGQSTTQRSGNLVCGAERREQVAIALDDESYDAILRQKNNSNVVKGSPGKSGWKEPSFASNLSW